jgi:hypothetical protein
MGKTNPWLVHLAKVRKANPKVTDVGKLAKLAKTTYKKK